MCTKSEFQLYRYRWVNLFLFSLFSTVNLVQFSQYTIIGNIIKSYYSIDTSLLNLTSLIFLITFIVLFLPTNYIINKFGLRISVILEIGSTALGNVVKLFSISPDRFYLVLVGQFFCSFGQILVFNVPTKLVNTWFGADEVSTACSIAILGLNLGSALGAVLPSLFVNSSNPEDTANGLNLMMQINAGISGACLLIALLFFRAEPPSPPNQTQVEKVPIKSSELIKELMKNKNFMIPLFSFCLCSAIWVSLQVVMNDIYLNYFPVDQFENSEYEVGIIVMVSMITGGCIGIFILGIVLDKTSRFKLVAAIMFATSCIALIFALLTLEFQWRLGACIALSIAGSFMSTYFFIGVEYLTEFVYPLPEADFCGIFNVVFSILITSVTYILDECFVLFGYFYTIIAIIVIIFLLSLSFIFVEHRLNRRSANNDVKIDVK